MEKKILGGRGVGKGGVAGLPSIPSTPHNKCRLFFPANLVTWFYRAMFFKTNVYDLDDECQVIHCVAFVEP